MHELGIANAVLETARTELRNHGDAHPQRLGLRVGDWSGVDPEALRFCLNVLMQDTEFACTELEIERCPRRNRCPECRIDFPVIDYDVHCPSCGATNTEVSGGTELALAFIELEEV